MPTIRFSRPFSSGSRPTPDPYDQFLDSHGFYRKHTARDPANLFRVISEQLYDTQDHHKQVRKDCVNYMIKHRVQYEESMGANFDRYIEDMARPDTFGTLTELRAIGYLFKRNIILYTPFNLGKPFVDEPDYGGQPALRVFHSSHFDSVFEKSYIMDAAFCQSIVYEMLYKKVFQLPDIEYSVETMLHSDINHEPSKHEYENGDSYATAIVFEDGRKFELDRPEDTKCILKEKDRCHFHNKDFEECVKRDARRYETAILSDKFNSCVRQLLFDGITPFPYKVAKSLDPNIYRNVEFDAWSEERKLAKQKQCYKVGVDCLVKVTTDDHKDELLKCCIQAKMRDDTFIVYIDGLKEKRLVPWAHLRPLHTASHSPRGFFPMRNGAGVDGPMRYDRFDYNLHGNAKSRTKFRRMEHDYEAAAICNSTVNLDAYTNLSNFSPAPREIVAYPIYTQNSGNMNSASGTANGAGAGNNPSNGNSSAANAQKLKNQRQHNNGQQASDDSKPLTALKIDTDNNGGVVAYAKGGHESKSDSHTVATPTTSAASAAVQPQAYQYQAHHQMTDPNAVVDTTSRMPAGTVAAGAASQPPMSSYYHPGTTAPAPVYYYPTPADDQSIYSASDMVMHPAGVYAIPAAYQQPTVQPNMYAPAMSTNQTTHYSVPVNGWPAYTPTMNPQGYVFSAPPPYAVPTVPAPMPMPLPFLSRDLLRSNGRINFNLSYAHHLNGDDLPLKETTSLRFFYNLGIEYFKYLQQVHGYGGVMAMIDGDNVSVHSGYDQTPSVASDADTASQHQLMTDFQHFTLDTHDIDTQSPTKQYRSYNDNNYRRFPNPKFKRYDRNDRPMSGAKHFQGTYQGPAKNFIKSTPKYGGYSGTGGAGNNGNGNSTSYESTPMKDNGAKMHHQQQYGSHSASKRDQQQPQQQQLKDFEVDQAAIGTHFGSNVPPYPFHDQNESQYAPPGNAYVPRVTPPTSSRPSSAGYYHQQHGVSQNAPSLWLQNAPPPGLHQPPNQSHSLNTSSASNPSL